MSALIAILTPGYFGPRKNYLRGQPWKFSLRVTVAYNDEPAPTDRSAWAKASLPWNVFSGSNLKYYTASIAGGVITNLKPLTVPTLGSPPAVFNTFNGELMSEIENKLDSLIAADTGNKVLFKWQAPLPKQRYAGPQTIGRDTDNPDPNSNTPTTPPQLVLAGLLKSLGSLSSEFSLQLKANWLFQVDSNSAPANLTNQYLLVFPDQLTDSRIGQSFALSTDPAGNPAITVLGDAADPIKIFQVGYGPNGDSAYNVAQALDLTIPAAAAATSLANTYWFKVGAINGDGYGDVEQQIDQGLDNLCRLCYPRAEDLAPLLQVSPSTAAVPDNLTLAKYLLSQARSRNQASWTAPSPEDQAAYSQFCAGRRQKVADFLKQYAAQGQNATLVDFIKSQLTDDVAKWWQFAWTAPKDSTADKDWTPLAILNDAYANSIAPNPSSPVLTGFQNVTQITLANAQTLAQLFYQQVFSNVNLDPATAMVPVQPNEGINIRAGDPSTWANYTDTSDWLVHQSEDKFNDSEASQIAAMGILVRRCDANNVANTRAWHVITSGLGVLDKLPGQTFVPTNGYLFSAPFGSITDAGGSPELVNTQTPLVGGLASNFINGVQRNEFCYRGENLRTPSALVHVHRQSYADLPNQNTDNDKLPVVLSSLSFQPPGALKTVAAAYPSSLSTPLRYGDSYEFAAFAIDRAGGLPNELMDPANPLFFGWSTLGKTGQPATIPTPPFSTMVQFLRRVPVGDLTLVPSDPTKPWPKPPAGVSLRATEWLEAQLGKPGKVPVLLLGNAKDFKSLQATYTFTVKPPCLDEFTLQRWAMPPIGTSDTSDLQNALVKIYTNRDNQLASYTPPSNASAARLVDPNSVAWLPHDPAVTAYGLRWRRVAADGTVYEKNETVIEAAAAGNFLMNPISITVSFGPNPTAGASNDESNGNNITLWIPAGEFCAVELLPLVQNTNQDFSRFDAVALDALIDKDAPTEANGTTHFHVWVSRDKARKYTGFEPVYVLVESATILADDVRNKLPAMLFNGLGFQTTATGNVAVSLACSTIAGFNPLAYFDSFSLSRQRWTWRNRPNLPPDGGWPDDDPVNNPNLDSRRQASGGLPGALFNQQSPARESDGGVQNFDILADIDHGFVDRGMLQGQLPRSPGGAPLASMLLVSDDRDAQAAAEYLRFGFAIKSRYATVISDPNKAVIKAIGDPIPTTDGNGNSRPVYENPPTWRRVTVPYRGDINKIKPLKIFTVLPLTRSPANPAFGAPANPVVDPRPTPFLVVLDETWFREYGQGETLEAYVAIESKETGDARTLGDFQANDIINLKILAQQFASKQPGSTAATPKAIAFIWNNLVAKTQSDLLDYLANKAVPSLKGELAVDLTTLISQRNPMDDLDNFSAVQKAEDTANAIEQAQTTKPSTGSPEAKALYRMLIEDTFPVEFGSVWRPYRVGPLPDHYITPANNNGKTPYFLDKFGDADEEGASPAIPLQVFGPFGYTMDISDNEALANATAFVVYPPPGVKSNWWMGVCLRRTLETLQLDGKVDKTPRSDASGVRHFYTRPGDIVKTDPANPGTVTLKSNSSISWDSTAIAIDLGPVLSDVPGVRGQYAALLILGRSAADGGTGSDLFLPQYGCWLNQVSNTSQFTWQMIGNTAPDNSTPLMGRIAIILLNGRVWPPPDEQTVASATPAGSSKKLPPQLANIQSLTDFWQAMLPTAPQNLLASNNPDDQTDCPGLITAISDPFSVVISKS